MYEISYNSEACLYASETNELLTGHSFQNLDFVPEVLLKFAEIAQNYYFTFCI